MGKSVKSIPFFEDTIKINAHTASAANLIGPVTIRRFAAGQCVKLEQVQETGELVATRSDGAFIHGPEV